MGGGLAGIDAARRVQLGVRRNFRQEPVVENLSVRQNLLANADHVCGPGKVAVPARLRSRQGGGRTHDLKKPPEILRGACLTSGVSAQVFDIVENCCILSVVFP